MTNSINTINFEMLFKALPGPHLVIGVDDPHFTIIYENEAHGKLGLTTPEKAIGSAFFDMFPDNTQKFKETGISDLAESLRTVIRTGKEDPMPVLHYDLPDDNGNLVERWWRATHYPIFNDKGDVAYIYQSTEDITNEIKTQQTLQLTKGQLDSALEAGLVSTWFWNIDSDSVIGDKNLAKHFAMSEEEVSSGLPLQTFLNSIHPDERDHIVAAIQSTARDGTHYEEEYRTVDSKGSINWVIARGRRFKNESITYLAGTLVDITARKNAEDENKKLRAINQTKDEFISLASHQLRTPATGVKQYVGMVLEGYAGDISDLQRDMLQKANISNERQLQIIDDLLNVAKADSGQLHINKSRTDIAKSIRHAVEDQQLDFKERNQKLQYIGPKDPLFCLIDADTIRMAVSNLIDNASKYSNENTVVSVNIKQTKHAIKILVVDQGIGISQEDISKLFKKFSRLHNKMSIEVGGSGLGLYWARKVAELHDGTIDAHPNKSHGTTFTITLPRAN